MDMNWLASEAKGLHEIFNNLFYVAVLLALTIAVVLEYFKLPLGGIPQFTNLIGRVFIAAIMLVALPELMNMLASATDAVVQEIGGLTQFSLVMHRMSEKLGSLSFSWVSMRDLVILAISSLTFYLLYLTVYLMDAFFIFSWMMLYIMSPLLIALFVLPATQGATRQLFKSLFEVCAWKITWGVLSALLWSFALSDINQPQHNIDFLTAIIVNLMLAFSVILTPKITSAFLGGGISQVANTFGDTMLRATQLTPQGMVGKMAANTVGKDSYPRKALRALSRPARQAFSGSRKNRSNQSATPKGIGLKDEN